MAAWHQIVMLATGFCGPLLHRMARMAVEGAALLALLAVKVEMVHCVAPTLLLLFYPIPKPDTDHKIHKNYNCHDAVLAQVVVALKPCR